MTAVGMAYNAPAESALGACAFRRLPSHVAIAFLMVDRAAWSNGVVTAQARVLSIIPE